MTASNSSANLDDATTQPIRSSNSPLGKSSIIRGGTGPRTLQGKRRSSQNSLRHGIFSRAVVLDSESKADFNALLNGLRDNLRPVGALEEGLVEMLAVTWWRQRRLLIAEGAEVQAATESLECEEKESLNLLEDLPSWAHFGPDYGLIGRIVDPKVLPKCLELLRTLRTNIEATGFDEQNDKEILTKVYGDLGEQRSPNDLFKIYLSMPTIARERGTEESKLVFLRYITNELTRFAALEEEHRLKELKRMKLESLRRRVPDSPRLDQLLRYSTSLERTFDRTLRQLERAQRMRLGQAVPPPINVNVSHS